MSLVFVFVCLMFGGSWCEEVKISLERKSFGSVFFSLGVCVVLGGKSEIKRYDMRVKSFW